jgi:ATP-binding cassette, subfamily G (WHITE), member 2
MGASGAGKSTLLDLVADRKRVGVASGQIMIDGQPRTPWLNRNSAYVLQDDLHIATLTVAETIRFAAWTRMPEGTSEEQREKRVELLLGMMTLQHVRNSRVGDAMTKGISGGELKRLSIAVEIVSLPGLIFLDGTAAPCIASCALSSPLMEPALLLFAGESVCVGMQNQHLV